jgi:hypothetical protein
MQEPYPVDYSTLAKGSVIEAEQCEHIIGKRRDHRLYSVELLRLRQRIMRDMRKRGTPVTVRTVNGSLEVLTDAQASVYNARQGRSGLRRHVRTHHRNLEVDTSKLTAEELKDHERRVLRSARLIQAINSVRQQLKIEARPRVAPAISQS